MTYDEKINYLSSYLYLKKECKELQEHLEHIEFKKSKISGGIINISKTNDYNNHSRLMYLLEETELLENKIISKMNEYTNVLEKIELDINKLDDIREQQLLRYRYIYGYTFQKIADKMHYNDKSYVHKCHKKIIQKINL